MLVSFHIPITPMPKLRARTVCSAGKTWSFTPKKTVDYEYVIANHAKPYFKEPLAGVLRVEVDFLMPIPASWSEKKKALYETLYCKVRPDLDNLLKAVCDALNGIAWIDDNQIVEIATTKRYSSNPSISVSIVELKNEPFIPPFLD